MYAKVKSKDGRQRHVERERERYKHRVTASPCHSVTASHVSFSSHKRMCALYSTGNTSNTSPQRQRGNPKMDGSKERFEWLVGGRRG